VSGHRDKADQMAAEYGVPAKNICNYANYHAIAENREIDAGSTALPNGMHASVSLSSTVAARLDLRETDRATFAYLCDVYVIEEYSGRGLGKWLVQEMQSHPDLQGIRRFVLVTRDAHGLYGQFGFQPLQNPGRYMEIVRPDSYKHPLA